MAANFINPETMEPPDGYTHVVEVTSGRPVYISGQLALDRDGNLADDDIRSQTRQVFDNGVLIEIEAVAVLPAAST